MCECEKIHVKVDASGISDVKNVTETFSKSKRLLRIQDIGRTFAISNTSETIVLLFHLLRLIKSGHVFLLSSPIIYFLILAGRILKVSKYVHLE